MKLLTALAGSLALAGSAPAEFLYTHAQLRSNPNPDQLTWRVYARFDDAMDRISAYAGLQDSPLWWDCYGTDGLINDDGYYGEGHVNDLPFGDGSNVAVDSWLTIGQVGGFDGFPQFSPDFLGVPGGEELQVLVDGLTFFHDEDSAVFIAGGSRVDTWGGGPTFYDVTLAQFTLANAGRFGWQMGGILQWFDPDNQVHLDEFYAYGVPPAPGALPLLALAGLRGAHRRRR